MEVLFRKRRYYKDKICFQRDRINANFSKYRLLSCDHTLQTLSEKNIRMEAEMDKVAKPIPISGEKQRKTVPLSFYILLQQNYVSKAHIYGRITEGWQN